MVRKVFSTLLTTLLIMMAPMAMAQAPDGVHYQAVARDGNGDILSNQNLTIRMTIKEGGPGGTTVYQETHSKGTNDFGLFELTIGEGSAPTGTFSNIDWGSNSFYLQVEVDPDGSGYVNLGTTKFVSVPYALYAKEAGNAGTSYNAGNGIDISGNTISNTGDTDATDDITNSSNAGGDVSGTFNNLTVEGIQGRSVSGSAPNSGQVLKWDGSQWAPANDDGGGGGSYSAGTGINITGANVIENTAPDQVVTLNGSGATSVSGTYPNFTISSTDNNTTYSAGTGLNLSGTQFNAQADAAIWNANEIHGIAVAKTSPNSGEVLKYDGSQWVPSTDATGGGGSSVWSQSGSDIYYNSGNVGIGTANPSVGLDVEYSGSEVASYNSTSSFNSGYIGFYEQGSLIGYWGSYTGGDDDVDFGTGAGNSTGSVHLTLENSPALTVENTGDVGIGTTSPSNRLQVEGGKAMIGSANGVIAKLTVNSTTTGEDVFRARKDNATQFLIDANGNVGVQGDPDNEFSVDGTADIEDDLGIGTNSPTHKLEVTDDLSSRSVMVNFSPTNIGANDDALEIDAGSGAPNDFQFIELQRGAFNSDVEFQVMGDGRVNMNMTGGPRDLNIKQNTQNTSEAGIYIERADNTDNWAILHASTDNLWFKHNDLLASWIEPSGTYQTSDRRAKDEIQPINNVLDRVVELKASSYYYKNDKNKKNRTIGFIAQDVQDLFPEVVGYEKDADRYGINYSAMSVLAIKAIQEQQSEIEDLQQENKDLQQQLDDLKQRVEQMEK